MITLGLKDREILRLIDAGFTLALARAVWREAQTMRWLFLRRGMSGPWASFGVVAVGVVAFFATLRVSDIAWLIGAAGSVVPMVQYAPHLEAWSLKGNDPARYAARTLAILAVAAARADGEGASQQADRLQTLAQGVDPLAHPHTQLRLIARAMDAAAASKRDNRKAVASSDGMRAALLFGLSVLAVILIIVTLALGARPF
ncbi:MAG: hypothetical protein GC187_06245 [Alphaproteobacteria bacterium]|nr:hypothetical protein [Alphaproteobacteria bacterium]